jgi:hypothetical protein
MRRRPQGERRSRFPRGAQGRRRLREFGARGSDILEAWPAWQYAVKAAPLWNRPSGSRRSAGGCIGQIRGRGRASAQLARAHLEGVVAKARAFASMFSDAAVLAAHVKAALKSGKAEPSPRPTKPNTNGQKTPRHRSFWRCFLLRHIASQGRTRYHSNDAETGNGISWPETYPTPHSLRSEGVKTALNRHWERSRRGADTRTNLAFLANGGAAREQDLNFPNDEAGLDYWAKAAADADTAPVRTALMLIFKGEPIGDWIARNPSDEELRARLLRRVQWQLRAADDGPLTEYIRDKVCDIFLEKGLLAGVGDEALRGLFDRVFETACQRSSDNRKLAPRDLHRSIEIIAQPSAALQAAVRALSGGFNPGLDSTVVSVVEPQGFDLIDRATTVERILKESSGEPILWLHGSMGTGKSTLARMLTGQIPGLWLSLDLRLFQNDGQAALSAWADLRRAISRNQHQLRGILLDDLSPSAHGALQKKLVGFLSSAVRPRARIIVTSNFEPSPARVAELGSTMRAIVQAPYVTEEEVRALISLRDSPSSEMIEAWSRLLFVATYSGHPMLVHAKIATLRDRAWPLSALDEDLGPYPSEAVRATRDEARRRLVDDLPSEDARRLLGRLGCIFDKADDALALKLANKDPPIPHAGDILAILRGSWIEPLPGGDMRLSPLIADIGRDATFNEKMSCHETATIHWLGSGTLNPRTLPLCFWNAFFGKVSWIVTRLCQVLLEGKSGVAALLSPMTALSTEDSIYPDDPAIASMLRLVQFQVCDAVGDNDAAERVAARLIVELEEIEHADLKALQTSIAGQKLLLARNVHLDPAFQLTLIRQLRPALLAVAAITKDAGIAERGATIVPGGDLLSFLSSSVVMRIRSSDQMLRMIEALDQASPEDRNALIDSNAAVVGSKAGAFVHTGWAREQLAGGNLRPGLERFERMSLIAANWGRVDISVQLACARSTILDEGLHEKEKAIAVIDEASSKLGDNALLTRQKAKVLGHAEDYVAATALIVSVEETVAVGDPFDRALALRDGAVWAARAEQLPTALRLFKKAFDELALEGEHMALATGLKIEIALILWAMGERANAVAALAEAFEDLEGFDPAASRANERVHQFGRAAAGLFWHQLAPFAAKEAFNITTGQPSALSGDEPLLGAELKPLWDNWRILTLCELEIGADRRIETRSNKRLPAVGGMAFIEMFIAMARYCNTIPVNDIAASFLAGSTAIAVTRISNAALGEDATRRVVGAEIEEKRQDILSNPDAATLEYLRLVTLDILMWRRFRGQWSSEFLSELKRAATDVLGSSAIIGDVLDAAGGNRIGERPSAAVALAGRLAKNPDLRGDPGARFDRDLLLVCHAGTSFGRRILEPVVVEEIVGGWSNVIANERFALRSPLSHVSEIAAAIEDARSTGLKGAARVLLAAVPAVKRELTDGWRDFLVRIIGDKSQPGA